MEYKDFANYFKCLRMDKGYKQKDVANLLLINKSRYCKMENGVIEPDFFTLQLICRFLEIDLTEILELKKPIQKQYIVFD